jgi:hypothetical protein
MVEKVNTRVLLFYDKSTNKGNKKGKKLKNHVIAHHL